VCVCVCVCVLSAVNPMQIYEAFVGWLKKSGGELAGEICFNRLAYITKSVAD